MDRLQVFLFGGFTVEHGHEPLPPIPSRVGRALFAYLVTHRDRSHTRASLAARFWPDLPEARARRRLSHTVWQITDSLAEVGGAGPYLAVHSDVIAFNRDATYWLDVEEFEQRVTRRAAVDDLPTLGRATDLAALTEAVELYRGDFLADFYDEWVLAEQERLRQMHLSALASLVEISKGNGSYEAALTYARRQTQHDPLREEAHREVMRLCVLLGRTSEALTQFERCRSVLDEELGTTPAGATLQLYDRIARQRTAAGAPTRRVAEPSPLADGDELEFVGRDRERAVMVDRMEQVLAGRGGVVLVEGEPGVGKSRLVAEAVEDAHWRGFTVLRGACRELGVARPYQAIGEALEETLSPLRMEQVAHRVEDVWLHAAARVIPRLRRGLPTRAPAPALQAVEESQRMREGLTRLISELGNVAPTVLVIEDLHWADEETLQVLRSVAARARSTRVMLVLSYRGDEARARDEVWETVRAVDRDAHPDRVTLTSLSAFGTAELLRSSLRAAAIAPAFATRVHRATGGNPLFVLELLREMLELGALPIASDGTVGLTEELEDDQLPVARGIHDVITDRVLALPADAQDILETAAVQGEDLELDTILHASGMSRPEVADGLVELLRRGLLIEDGDRYAFGHTMTRRVVYQQLPDARRTLLHGEIADALTRTHPDRVEALGHHLAQAGRHAQAARYLVAAAHRSVELHAYDTAARHYDEAILARDQTPSSLEAMIGLLGDFEAVLDVLARRERQAAVLERMEILAGSNTLHRTEVLRRRAWLLAHTDRFDDAAAAATSAVEMAREHGEDDPLGPALVALGTVLTWKGELAAAVPHLEEAVEAYRARPVERAAACFSLGTTLRELGRYDAAERWLDEALASHEETGDVRGRAQTLAARGTARMERGEPLAAEADYRRSLQDCQNIGYRHFEGVNLVNLGNLLFVRGDIGGALEGYAQAAEVFGQIGNRRGEALTRVNIGSVRHTMLGDDEVARHDVDLALAYFREIGDDRAATMGLDTLAGIELRAGHLDGARAHLDEALGLVTAGSRWLEVQLRRSSAELELTSGQPGTALEHAQRALALCDEFDLGDQRAAVAGLCGAALLALGRVDDAIAMTQAAVAALDVGVDRAYVVRLRHHDALLAAGRIFEARSEIARAYDGLMAALDGIADTQRETALHAVPEHREVVAAWRASRPRKVTLRVAADAAPTGRPLRSDEYVEVALTLESPDDAAIDDDVARRQMVLRRLLDEAAAQHAAPTVGDLADVLGVSQATVRRDLKALRERGHDIATRGSRAG